LGGHLLLSPSLHRYSGSSAMNDVALSLVLAFVGTFLIVAFVV
jgi:hypothetical protein